MKLHEKLSFFWKRRRWFGVDVPACATCARALARTHWLRKLAYFGVVAIACGVAGWLTWTNAASAEVCVGIAVAFLLPVVVYEVLRPEAVFLAEKAEVITYEFRDRRYAEEFARLNGGVVE